MPGILGETYYFEADVQILVSEQRSENWNRNLPIETLK